MTQDEKQALLNSIANMENDSAVFLIRHGDKYRAHGIKLEYSNRRKLIETLAKIRYIGLAAITTLYNIANRNPEDFNDQRMEWIEEIGEEKFRLEEGRLDDALKIVIESQPEPTDHHKKGGADRAVSEGTPGEVDSGSSADSRTS